MTRHLQQRVAVTAVVALATGGLVAIAGPAASEDRHGHGPQDDRTVMMEYAADTWASFAAMVDPATGLPADNIEGDLDPAT
ncbi:MAG: cellobiose phosphorylase, partial [Actinobacteria bacterium]|nr:cellobiose phosphorylase [Actinomycetota bacterium]